MEQQPLPPAPSLGKSITDVFQTPSDIFQSLKGTASAPGLWVVPMVLSMLMVVLFTVVIFGNDTLKGQIVDQQRAALEKKVDEGSLTRQEADRRMEGMENAGPAIFIAFGSIAGAFFIALAFFGGTLFLWLTDKIALKSTEGYGKHLEMYGISTWIGILGGIVTLCMMVGLGSMAATPSAALAVLGNYDMTNHVHKLLSALNIFSIWQAAVAGIGLSKLSGKSTGAGMGVAFVLWIIWVAVSVALGLSR